jgi:hypothetical protein
MHASTIAKSAVAIALIACADSPSPTEIATSTAPTNTQTTVQHNAPTYWNAAARGLIVKYSSNALFALRAYALVGVAQHNAAAAVNDRGVHAAVSAASVVVLSYLFPAEQTALELELQQYLANTSTNPDPNEGVSNGRAVAATVVTYAQGDRFFAPWTGSVPVGPGKWFSATPPAGPTVGGAKTYYLTTGSQFRPAPPPEFGSPAFNKDLAEVRQISDTRTKEQDSIAKFWAMPNGTTTPAGFWNEEATRLIAKYRLNERASAHLFAWMHQVGHDAIVASHEAKFFYWLLRPTMADPGIVLPIGLPNFPSYPSNHSAISGGMAAILGSKFAAERNRLKALADEASVSRVYGGIHYRFDGVAGLLLGRRIAELAETKNVPLRTPFPLPN